MWWNLFLLCVAVASSTTTKRSLRPTGPAKRGGGGGGSNRTDLYLDPHCGSRQVIVQLFEWTWVDVARECESYLGDNQFCAVQVSPPNEHVVTDSPPAPWWERYQPVSYKLTSRSGSEQEFASMVSRCNAAGVRVYVDAVFNNMAEIGRRGRGSAGSSYDSDFKTFPAVPYGPRDFNDPSKCSSANSFVTDYTSADEMRNCSFDGLTDLDQSSEHVQNMVSGYLNQLIDLGVSGFRIDSATFMWPSDLEAIENRLHDLPGGGRPFMILEVEDYGNDVINSTEYTHLGYVTDYEYGRSLAQTLTTSQDLNDLRHFSSHSPGMLSSDHALVFVDNHETQRMPQEGTLHLSHREPTLYTMATAFTLAHDYGFVRLMSSYHFTNLHTGPPSIVSEHYKTMNVPVLSNGTCGGGWVCEHRWPAISAMVQFRNTVHGTDVNHWTSQADFLAFSRGDVGFFAMTSDDSYQDDVKTNLPPGRYCELVSQCRTVVTVDGQGMVRVALNRTESPFMAILTDWPAVGVLPESSQLLPTVTASFPMEASSLLPPVSITSSMEQNSHLFTPTQEFTMTLESTGISSTSEILDSSLGVTESTAFVTSVLQNSQSSLLSELDPTLSQATSDVNSMTTEITPTPVILSSGDTSSVESSLQRSSLLEATPTPSVISQLLSASAISDNNSSAMAPFEMTDSVSPSSTGLDSTSSTYLTSSSYVSYTHTLLTSSEDRSVAITSSGETPSSSLVSTAVPMLTSPSEQVASSVLPAVSESLYVRTTAPMMTSSQSFAMMSSMTTLMTSPVHEIKPTMTFATPSTSMSSAIVLTSSATIISPATTSTLSTITTAATTTTTSTTTTTTPLTTTESPFKRTVILLERQTSHGEYIFFRGGIDEHHKAGCGDVASDSNPCAIQIRYREEGQSGHYTAFNTWRQGDHFLDWHGPEPDQRQFQGQQAQGSPGIWTTNRVDDYRYSSLNTYGEHYWLLDVDMDCTNTDDGYFEFKGFSTKSGWVGLPSPQPPCSGSGSSPHPFYSSGNHFARCGYLNVYRQSGACQINEL